MNLSRRDLIQTSTLGGLAALLSPGLRAEEAGSNGKRIRGVVFMVSDGMSQGVISMSEALSRQTRGQGTHWWNTMQGGDCAMGLMDTGSANSMVTDSAAASSSWGGGQRVPNGQLNVTDKGKQVEPLADKLGRKGVKLGLVSTASITHATPAGFAVCNPNRNDEKGIAEQYLGKADIYLGGGSKFFDPKQRRDKKDIYAMFEKAGYGVVHDRDGLIKDKSAKILGAFYPGHMPYSIDHMREADLKKKVPTLAEMSAMALKRLLAADAPFLLQIEGARVDHAAHANDIGAILADQIAFDDAIGTVKKFIEGRDDILVVLTSDHGNSNPGLNGMGGGYGRTNQHFQQVARIKASHEWLQPRLKKGDITALVKEHLGFEPSKRERELIGDTLSGKSTGELNHLLDKPAGILGQITGNHTGTGWTGTVHTSDPTLITAFGPEARRFQGLVINTEIHNILMDLLG